MTSPLDLFRLDGHVALVTGGGNGIGRATSEVLAAAGAHVVVADLDATAADAAAVGIVAGGGGATAERLDVAETAAVDAAIGRIVETHGRLDVVCNVAGVYAASGHVVDIDDAELDRVVAVNLKGTFACCRSAVRAMAPQRAGSIVNVASSVVDIPVAGHAVYAMTKAAIVALSRVLADEAGPLGIRVNAIAPGPTITDFTRHNAVDETGEVDEERWAVFLDRMRDISPLGVVGEPIDQALLVLYLVSPAGRLATGNVFRVNAGVARPG